MRAAAMRFMYNGYRATVLRLRSLRREAIIRRGEPIDQGPLHSGLVVARKCAQDRV